jgi:hypothetical protein
VQPVAAAAPAAGPIDERMNRLEHSLVSVLSILRNMVGSPRGTAAQAAEGQQ